MVVVAGMSTGDLIIRGKGGEWDAGAGVVVARRVCCVLVLECT